MANQDPLFDALAEFARTLVGRYEVADVLHQLTDRVVPVLGIDGAGVSLSDEQKALRFVTASTDALNTIERTQEELQQGPCVSAFQDAKVTTAPDLNAETRWPQYRPVALAEGLEAVAALPLRSADGCIGSLNLYSRQPRQWDDDGLFRALLLADIAASYVTNASELQR